jgi:SAM-dependent methyltransferase
LGDRRARHRIQNPVTDRKLRLLDDYCDIRDGLKVLDIGCGKAWVMRQWAERFAINGTGLEINPLFVRDAKAKAAARGVAGKLNFIEDRPPLFRRTGLLRYRPRLGELCTRRLRTGRLDGGGNQAWRHHRGRRPDVSITCRYQGRTCTAQRRLETIGVIERHGAVVSAPISVGRRFRALCEPPPARRTQMGAGEPELPRTADVSTRAGSIGRTISRPSVPIR